MSLSMYTASVPVFQHTLKAMSAFLSKAEAHAKPTNLRLKLCCKAVCFRTCLP